LNPGRAALRVLVVEDHALEGELAQGILGARPEMEVVHAASIDEARARLKEEAFDFVIGDEGRLRSVLDAIFAFVGLFSLDGVVVDVNRVPLVSSGLSRAQVVGRRFVDLPWFSHSVAERERISEGLARAAHGEKPRFATSIRRTGGGLMHVDAAFAPLRDSTGTITHVVGTGVDISARVEAERALARSEARLLEAQRVAHVGSWEWEVGHDAVAWSAELYRIYGLGPGQFDGTYQGFLSRVHPDDREHTQTVVRQALENVTPFIYDHRILRPDGSVRMLHTRGDVIPNGDGRARRLVGSCWDVTDRWEATQRLEHSISLLQSTLEATADGILVVSLPGLVTALNLRLRALWRLPDEVTEGTAIADILALVRDQLEDPSQFLSSVGELYGQPDIERLDILRFKDGRVFERYSRPQRDGGEIVGRVCSFRDVSQREHLLKSAQAARTSAERATEQLRALAARLDAIREEERRMMAREIHDQIGQALTALKLDLDGLRAGLPDGDARRRATEMNRLIDETLDTTRRLSVELRPPILDDLGLAPAIEWLTRDFEARSGIRCSIRLDGGATITGPEALVLYRIVQEALTNVARHAGASAVRIGLSADPTGTVLTVWDNGRGITAEEQARSSALGLAGMRERALVLGGEVQVLGSPGAGTTVTARLPRATPT
jgi:PAS domain S-box-containing protein